MLDKSDGIILDVYCEDDVNLKYVEVQVGQDRDEVIAAKAMSHSSVYWDSKRNIIASCMSDAKALGFGGVMVK